MKSSVIKTFSFICAFLLVLLSSCSKISQDAKGFGEIEETIKSKFGVNAYFTEIVISFDDIGGTVISCIATQEPSSLQLEQWSCYHSIWQQTANVALTITGKATAEDFMFKLGGKFDLRKIGDLVQTTAKKLETENHITEPVAKTVTLQVPNSKTIKNTTIYITMQPKAGGASYAFLYDLDGKLIDANY